jgi:hypothetical protein
MKEGRIEKIKKEGESVLEKIRKFREKEIEKGPSQWGIIDPKLLLPEAQKVFELVESGQLEAAKAELDALGQKVKEMDEGRVKTTNEAFITYFDDKVIRSMSEKETAEFKEKDNT